MIDFGDRQGACSLVRWPLAHGALARMAIAAEARRTARRAADLAAASGLFAELLLSLGLSLNDLAFEPLNAGDEPTLRNAVRFDAEGGMNVGCRFQFRDGSDSAGVLQLGAMLSLDRRRTGWRAGVGFVDGATLQPVHVNDGAELARYVGRAIVEHFAGPKYRDPADAGAGRVTGFDSDRVA